MRILITGGTGLLGKALIDTAGSNYEIIATYLDRCALSDTSQVRYRKIDTRDEERNLRLFMDFKPDVVIHAAGIGSPDYAEQHKDEARAVNVGGTRTIIRNCEKFKTKLIYVSSNGIYAGDRAPYSETDDPRPINFYGRLKLESENLARKAAVQQAIARPILMYGWNHPFGRSNIVTMAFSRLKNGEKVFVYDDVYVNPIFSECCARAIWKIAEDENYDIFNLAGKDRVSIYELVLEAARIFGLDTGLIVPVKQGFFNELVKRPKDTTYNIEKMLNVLKVEPLVLKDGLRMMKKRRSPQ